MLYLNIYLERNHKLYVIAFSLFLFFHSSLFSQQDKHWELTPYGDKTMKVTYHPDGYTHNENISDAVISKPSMSTSVPVVFAENALLLGENVPVVLHYEEDSVGYKGFSILLSDDERIYGGGERAISLNRRGYKFNLYNNPWYGYENGADNLNYSVPFFTSSKGYGVFFDNPSSGIADIGKSDPEKMRVTFFSGELNVYVIFGDTPAEILKRYHELTGTQGLPPRWALGNFMSRFGYSSEKQIFDIAKKMETEKIPFDGIIIDLFWFGDSIKGSLGNLAWMNKTKWPNPKKMISTLKKKNKKTILITEPFVLQSSINYDISKQYHAVDKVGNPYVLQDFYFGYGGLIDLFRNDAKEWFWKKHDEQNQIGVEGWWGDLGEPEKHPKDIYHQLKDMGFDRKFSADEVHNIYGHTWTKMLYENYSKYYPNKRLFSLNRSGFAGSQRYSIFPWSGDVSRSWLGLKAQLPIMLGMTMSGIPYAHSDAGGFAGGSGDYELYVRWLQFSAFTPIFRPHGTALGEVEPNAPNFPSEPALVPEPYTSAARDIVKLRYQLLPYNYTLAYRQSEFGAPLAAPLYYHYPNDKNVEKIENQFMWGDALMVVPITDKAKDTVKCILPKGEWYLFNLDRNRKPQPLSGKVFVLPALERPIVFAKAGAIIPVSPYEGESSEDFKTDRLQVHYYVNPKEASTFTMFDDDGITKQSIENGEYDLLTFTAIPDNLGFTLEVKNGHKNAKSKKTKKRNIEIVIHGLDEDQNWYYKDVNAYKDKVKIVNDGFSFDLKSEPRMFQIQN